MAWCLWQQRLVSEALSSGGLTVFSTVDGSPQGGYQWELEGHIYVKNSDLAELRQQALVLIMSTMVVEDGAEANDQDRDDVPEEIKEAFDKLTQALDLVQAPPVACGSGASSVWHKVHTFCHAHRLVSPSWEAVASVVASVFTITGDLGTERVLKFPRSLRVIVWTLGERHSASTMANQAKRESTRPRPRTYL